MHILRLIALVFPLLLVMGCDAQTAGDPVIQVGEDDVEMNAAMEKARATFGQFLANWKTMPNDGASIKVGLATPDDSQEHIWFTPTEITATHVTGTCGNDAVNIPDLRLGDIRTFSRDEISDWMILVGDTCYGGYTVRVLTKKQPGQAPPLVFKDFEDAN